MYNTSSTAITASETHVVVVMSNSPRLLRLSLEEGVIDSHYHRTKTHDIQRRKQAQRERKHEFDADLASALLCQLPSFGTRHFCVNPERFSDARAESIGLGQHRHE